MKRYWFWPFLVLLAGLFLWYVWPTQWAVYAGPETLWRVHRISDEAQVLLPGYGWYSCKPAPASIAESTEQMDSALKALRGEIAKWEARP